MTFQPVVPFGGFAGWSFLNRTRENQQQAFNNSVILKRNTDHFKENISKVTTAEQLVNDRRLLEVALGAYGLDEDINNKFFLQKILEDGIIDPKALGNRLSDKRYFEFSKAFGFGDFGTPNTGFSDFADKTVKLYQERQFEIAIGQTDESMRLALALDRDLDTILSVDTTEKGLWFNVMGQPPVRRIFETALGLPSSFGVLDLEQQLTGFREKTASRFGDSEIRQFSDPQKREELVRLFLVQNQIQNNFTNVTSGTIALTLLGNIA